MNEHPTTFKDRFTKISNINQSQNEKVADQTPSENPQQFWNPEELLNDAHFDNGILILNGPKNDDKNYQKVDKNSFKKWNDTINEIQKKAKKQKSSNSKQQDSLNSQLSFNIPQSQYQTKLYNIFYYNENKWFFDKYAFEEFSNDKKIADENAHTPIVCYFDSKEEDLILINSNFINGNYPKFEPDLNEKQDGNQNSSSNENDKSTKSKDKKKIKKKCPKKGN